MFGNSESSLNNWALYIHMREIAEMPVWTKLVQHGVLLLDGGEISDL